VPLDTKNDDLSLEEMLKNIDLKKEKRPDPIQNLLKKPLENVNLKASDPPIIEKKPNEGWEDEDLQIDLNEIEKDNDNKIEKTKEEPNEEKKSKLFSKLFDVKAYVAAKVKEEKSFNVSNLNKTS